MGAAAKRVLDGQGFYPLRVAAAYAHLPPKTVHHWARGYNYTHKGERRRSPPIQYLAHHQDNDAKLLDFEQLLTLLLVRAFRDRGLALTTIKKAAAKAEQVYQLINPFASNQFRSDGNKVFIDLQAPGKEREMIEILSDQHQFHEIVEPSLFKDVVFIGNQAREWWPLGRDHAVVVAPDRQFGAPHIATKGTRTDVIAQAVAAEGGSDAAAAEIAEWYGLTLNEVADAVYFEGQWLQQDA